MQPKRLRCKWSMKLIRKALINSYTKVAWVTLSILMGNLTVFQPQINPLWTIATCLNLGQALWVSQGTLVQSSQANSDTIPTICGKSKKGVCMILLRGNTSECTLNYSVITWKIIIIIIMYTLLHYPCRLGTNPTCSYLIPLQAWENHTIKLNWKHKVGN